MNRFARSVARLPAALLVALALLHASASAGEAAARAVRHALAGATAADETPHAGAAGCGCCEGGAGPARAESAPDGCCGSGGSGSPAGGTPACCGCAAGSPSDLLPVAAAPPDRAPGSAGRNVLPASAVPSSSFSPEIDHPPLA